MNGHQEYVLALAGINGIAAWGFAITLRSGQLSIGHAALGGIGAYAAGILTGAGHPLIIGLVVGVGLSAAVGLALSLATLRLNDLLFSIATLIFAYACQLGVYQIDAIGGSQGLLGIPVSVTLNTVTCVLIVGLAFEVLVLRRSRWSLRALLLAHDPVLADMGAASARRARVEAFVLGAAVVGLASVLRAHIDGVYLPGNMGFHAALFFTVYAVVGGASSSSGPFLGGIGLTLVTELLKTGDLTASVLFGGVLLAVCLARPNGLLNRRGLRVTRGMSSLPIRLTGETSAAGTDVARSGSIETRSEEGPAR